MPGSWGSSRPTRRRRWRSRIWTEALGVLAAVTVTGTLTGEGVECPALKGRDGQLYTLTGELGPLGSAQPGTRWRVTGEPARISFCMQGETLSVTAVERRRERPWWGRLRDWFGR